MNLRDFLSFAGLDDQPLPNQIHFVHTFAGDKIDMELTNSASGFLADKGFTVTHRTDLDPATVHFAAARWRKSRTLFLDKDAR